MLNDSIDRGMDHKIYGFLRKSKRGEFTYCCCDCNETFTSGSELEHHISLAHSAEVIKSEIEFVDERSAVQQRKPVRKVKKESSSFSKIVYSSDADKSIDDDIDDFGGGDDGINDGYGDDNDGDEIEAKESKPDIETVQPESEPSSLLECTICNIKYKNKRSWEKHMELRHGNQKELCSICGGEFIDIDVHMRSHRSEKKKEKLYSCKVCNAEFRHSSYLNIHMRVHTGEAPYMCYICGRTFISQGKLTHHTKRHSDVKEHKCDQCDRAYHERFQLKKHINIVHKGIRLFSCTLCDTSKFTTKKSLGQHMLLHGEKRFQCKFCDQKFAQGSGRRGHEKRVHGAV